MKKNYLFGLLSLFTLLFAASCQEDELAGGQMGDTATVTFQVNTPMLATRAVGDGTAVGKSGKLYVAVYEKDGQGWSNALGASKITPENAFPFEYVEGVATATVPLDLAKNKDYSIVFWAETNENGDAYSIDWDEGGKLSLNTTNLKANQESYDAFWAQTNVNLTGAMTKTIELKRPFAQLNIGTSDKEAAKNAGIVVEQTKVTVKQIPTTLNFQVKENTDGHVGNYADVTYEWATIVDDATTTDVKEGIEHEEFPADKPNQSYLSLNYIPMTVDKSLVDIEFKYKDEQDNDAYVLNFPSVPVQRNFRTNIYGTLLTNKANYTVEIKPGFGDDNEQDAGNIVYVTTQEDFEKALKRNDENIVINLMPTQQKAATRAAGNPNEFKIYVGAWTEKYYFGGVDTDSITINANGCTINFVHENGDWNYIRCVNDDAKWIINDAHLTNSGKNDGPWNRHDIRFYNAVELNNVTSDKAIAVLNDGKLTKVTISEEGDVYGLWITAEGQTVELDNCTFKTAGRGIAIKDEYIDNPALVDLTVKNTKFNTEKKAAILVTSTAGADITLENVDLSGVKADGFNAVWVDEDRAEHADKVTVTGGFCVVEDATPTAENNPFLVENGEVNLPAGTFVIPTDVANGVTVIGAEDGTTVLDMTGANPSNKKDLTFKNVTINVGNEIYHGMTHTSGLTYDNCVINGTLFLYSTAVFNNCTFNVEDDNYNVWTYGSTEATFNTCTFNCDGKSVLVYNEGHNGSVITMNQCQFFARAAVEGKAAVEIDSSLLKEGMTYVVNLNGCTVQGFGLGSVSNEMLFNQKKGSKATIYVDGVKTVSTEAELKAAIKAANNTEFTKLALTSKTFTGAFDIDGKSVELVALNRHQATIDGLVFGLGASHIKLNGIKLTNAHPVASESPRHKADYYCLGAYAAEFVIDDCVFDVNNQGQAAGKGAINIGDGFNANQNPYELTVTNTVFNCNGERPIRAKTRSYIQNCTFNDQHRYAIQVQGNEQAPDEVVVFRNNIINNPCQTSGELFAAGVSISKSQKLSYAAFTIEGNIMNSTEFANLKFVYDNHDNVKITTCTLNGKTIVEDQCVSILNEDEAKEVILDFNADLGTYCATEADFTAALNAGKAKIVLAPGTYEGTYAMKDDVTIQSMDDKNMATVGCINLNGAENITLKNIQFDAAGAQLAYDGKGNERFYGNIISGDASKNGKGTNGLVIDGCVFTGTFANGGTTIAFNDQGRGSGQSGNITIKNCTFETVGGYVDIYTYYSGKGNLIIENNIFNSTVDDRPIYLGKYQSSTPVVVKGNAFMKVADFAAAAYIQPHSTSYTVSFDESGNTFAQ